jgi:hypothetical protein
VNILRLFKQKLGNFARFEDFRLENVYYIDILIPQTVGNVLNKTFVGSKRDEQSVYYANFIIRGGERASYFYNSRCKHDIKAILKLRPFRFVPGELINID